MTFPARNPSPGPGFKTLKFRPAFLKDGSERIPPNKLTRSEDIYHGTLHSLHFAAMDDRRGKGDHQLGLRTAFREQTVSRSEPRVMAT